jgi:integrase
MASVQPRTNSRGNVTYRVQFRLDGKMTSRSFEHRKGADQFASHIDAVGPRVALETLEARQGAREGVPPLRDWIDTYLDPQSGILTGISPGTRAGYRAIADRSIIPVLGDLPVDAITKRDIGRWVEWQESQKSRRRMKPGATPQPVAAKTVKNYHALLSAILTASIEAGHRTDNPAFKIALTRGSKREGVFLSMDDVATITHFMPNYYVPLVLFLVATGLRWGEATALTWGDVVFIPSGAVIRVNKAWKKGPDGKRVLGVPKSAASERLVELDLNTVNILGQPRPGREYLFPGVGGGPIWYGIFRARIWQPAVTKANDPSACAAAGLMPIGKEPTIHSCRHTSASMLVAEGEPMFNVRGWLGHEDVATTSKVYSHAAPGATTRMAQAIGRQMSNLIPELEA